jgi:hypothetical protein
MRFHHIKQQLNEINMSPSHLRAKAAKIDAKVGIEYEMYVPDVATSDEDEWEADWDANTRAMDINDIIDFFTSQDAQNPLSSRDARRLEDNLEERYLEFYEELFENDWRNEEEDAVRKKWMDRWDEEDAVADKLEEMGVEDVEAAIRAYNDDDEENPLYDEYIEALEAAREELEKNVERSIYREDDVFEEAKDKFRADWEAPSQRDWLLEVGLDNMRDVMDEFLLDWPFYTRNTPEGKSLSDVAEEFEEAIGRPVKYSDSYHGARRDGTSYVLEPDGSLNKPNDPEDGGLEFVSPPLGLAEAFDDLRKVKAWADQEGCYTNETTGLHINVSISGYSLRNLDYVKLALLLGDTYILEQFGRGASTYAKSALGIVVNKLREVSINEERLESVFNSMRNHLELEASKAIHNGLTNKFTSINTKDGYIEFRSPGGDWLGENFQFIENTVLRFVVALDSAIDPDKNRQEYLKKLYKLLGVRTMQDPLAYFAQYAAGELPRSALKSFVRNIQAQRTAKATKDTKSFTGRWLIIDKSTGNTQDSVSGIGNTQDAAKNYLESWLRNHGANPSDFEIIPEMQ